MKKFAVPAYDVDNDKRRLEQAEKAGIDARNLIPAIEVGEASWSAGALCVPGQVQDVEHQEVNLALRRTTRRTAGR